MACGGPRALSPPRPACSASQGDVCPLPRRACPSRTQPTGVGLAALMPGARCPGTCSPRGAGHTMLQWLALTGLRGPHSCSWHGRSLSPGTAGNPTVSIPGPRLGGRQHLRISQFNAQPRPQRETVCALVHVAAGFLSCGGFPRLRPDSRETGPSETHPTGWLWALLPASPGPPCFPGGDGSSAPCSL